MPGWQSSLLAPLPRGLCSRTWQVLLGVVLALGASGAGASPPESPKAYPPRSSNPKPSPKAASHTSHNNSSPATSSASSASSPARSSRSSESSGKFSRVLRPRNSQGSVSQSGFPGLSWGNNWKQSARTVLGALAITLGAFVLLIAVLKRWQPPGMRPLPRDAFEVLGKAPIDSKHTLVLVRLGSKAALLSLQGGQVQVVLEINDPDQVTHLAGLCRQTDPLSSTEAFRQTLAQLAKDSTVASPSAGPDSQASFPTTRR